MLRLLDVKKFFNYTSCAVQSTMYNAVVSVTTLHIKAGAKSPAAIGIMD